MDLEVFVWDPKHSLSALVPAHVGTKTRDFLRTETLAFQCKAA